MATARAAIGGRGERRRRMRGSRRCCATHHAVAAADRTALERVAGRRRGRAPAGDGDLRPAARLARPGDGGRLAEGRRAARGDGGPPRVGGGHPARGGRSSRRGSRRPRGPSRSGSSARSARRTRSRRSGRLKPDERTALLLKAKGLSYREIGERQGWTYTKVNRAITEGRRRFLDTVARIESGEECERYAPTLLALTQGAAEAADVVALRPHLRHCGACRGTVRELVDSRRHRLALHLPFVAGVAPLRWLGAGDPAELVERGVGRAAGAARRDSRGFTGPTWRPGSSSARAAAVAAPRSPPCSRSASAAARGPTAWRRAALPEPVVRLVHPRRDPRRGRGQAGRRPRRRARGARPRRRRPPDDTPSRRDPSAPAAAGPGRAPAERPKPKPKPKRRAAPEEEEFGFEGTTGTPGVAEPAGARRRRLQAPRPRPRPAGERVVDQHRARRHRRRAEGSSCRERTDRVRPRRAAARRRRPTRSRRDIRRLELPAAGRNQSSHVRLAL